MLKRKINTLLGGFILNTLCRPPFLPFLMGYRRSFVFGVSSLTFLKRDKRPNAFVRPLLAIGNSHKRSNTLAASSEGPLLPIGKDNKPSRPKSPKGMNSRLKVKLREEDGLKFINLKLRTNLYNYVNAKVDKIRGCQVDSLYLIKSEEDYGKLMEKMRPVSDSKETKIKHLRVVNLNRARLIKINSIRGRRLKFGYPANGQRTRTNAKTAKKLQVKTEKVKSKRKKKSK